MLNAGQLLAAFAVVLPVDAPFATTFVICGFDPTTKFPQMRWNAMVKSEA